MGWHVVKSDSFLSHAGTKGMKWGVRKYQYEDGSLTAAGKRRYGQHPTQPHHHLSLADQTYTGSKEDWLRIHKMQHLRNARDYLQTRDKYAERYGVDKRSFMTKREGGPKAILAARRKMNDMLTAKGLDPVFSFDGRRFDEKAFEKYVQYSFLTSSQSEPLTDEQIEELAQAARKNFGIGLDTAYRKALEKINKQIIAKKAAQNVMPTSAKEAKITAAKEAEIKAKIPASAWNERVKGNSSPSNKTNSGSKYIPSSAIKGQKEAAEREKIKNNIPASAWNQMNKR